ncbi:MAG TPA: hypothetical protein VK206_22975 [Anaerolineales bacterium]|nr:hypothetical protein [Anaerolineales bacterium]
MMQKTIIVLGSILALLLSACLPIFTPTPGPTPTVDTAGTSDALFKTAVAQTLTAQPTITVVPPTNTSVVAVASSTLPPTETLVGFPTPSEATATLVPTANGAATATGNVLTATGVPANGTPTLAPSPISTVWTLAVRKYGTLPPAVPFSSLTLVNKAKTEAYISLQVTMPDGKYSVIEYPVRGTVKIQAPVGFYLYVAWVGGNKMVGNFRLHQDDEFSILLYKDKIVIK